MSQTKMSSLMSSPLKYIGQVEEYPYPSHVNVSNFVSVKLSGKADYPLWKAQMSCLIDAHDVSGFIKGKEKKTGDVPENRSHMLWQRSDTLLKGWIFGSLTNEVLEKVATDENLKTAEDVWNKLKRTYGDEATDSQEAGSLKLPQIQQLWITDPAVKEMKSAFVKGHWNKVLRMFKQDKRLIYAPTGPKGLTAVHVAITKGLMQHNSFLQKFLNGSFIEPDKLADMLSRTKLNPLHIAAAYGNTLAAELLLDKNPDLLRGKDIYNHWPIHKALLSSQYETSDYLLKKMDSADFVECEPISERTGPKLPSIAISAGFHAIALKLIHKIEDLDLEEFINLMTQLAKRPWDLRSWHRYNPLEKFIYKKLHVKPKDVARSSTKTQTVDVEHQARAPNPIRYSICVRRFSRWVGDCVYWLYCSVPLLRIHKEKSEHLVTIRLIHGLFRKILNEEGSADVLIAAEVEGSANVLIEAEAEAEAEGEGSTKVHDREKVDKLRQPIIEAAQSGAAEVIDVICGGFPEALLSEYKDHYTIFQLAILNRSEKVYSLMRTKFTDYDHFHRNLVDDDGNNILHLAARKGPDHKLQNIAGAALQMQYEFQWFKKIEEFVNNEKWTERNKNGETPYMVFVREHKDLWKDGEEWMKKTADSCTLTAALIITIVFAAAITVPGGTNNEGMPNYARDLAFIFFALSDAISLFASTTSLIIFLSVLTARYTDDDFRNIIPMRLIYGLSSLFLSTVAMVVAFGTTLFIMFGQEKTWIRFPIAAFACLPVISFLSYQFPLLKSLIINTYYGPFSDKYVTYDLDLQIL